MSLRKCTSLFSRRCESSFGSAVRSLTEAFHPAGVSVHFLRFIFLHTMLDVTQAFAEKRVFASSKPPICANFSVENRFSEKSGTSLSKTFTSNIFENTSFFIINYLKGVGLNGQSSNPT